MNAAIPLLIMGGLAGGAYLLTKKDEKKPATGGGETPPGPGVEVPPGAPPVPVVYPNTGVIRFGVQDWNNPGIFQEILTKLGAQPAMIFADMTFLLQESTVKDYAAYAAWLQSKGIGAVASYATARVANMRNGEYNFGMVFDANLPIAIRSWLEFQTLANRWSDFKANLQSPELAKYPLFRDSIWKAFSDRIGPPPEKSKPDGIDKEDFPPPPPIGGAVTPSGDFIGPGEYTSAYGTVMVPKGGRIVGGKPMHVIQEGQWGAAPIAKAWGKEFPEKWAPSIAGANPGKKWGKDGNVHPGDLLNLPNGFLDPYAVAPTPGGGPGNNQPGTPDFIPNIPPPPPGPPKFGHVWVLGPDGNSWVEVPIDPTNTA